MSVSTRAAILKNVKQLFCHCSLPSDESNDMRRILALRQHHMKQKINSPNSWGEIEKKFNLKRKKGVGACPHQHESAHHAGVLSVGARS